MKYKVALILVYLIVNCENKSEKLDTILIDVSDDIVVPKAYVVGKTEQDILIDGINSEPAWSKAKFTDNFIDIEGIKTPKYRTRAKMLWDKDYLYVYAELEEPHIWGYLVERDTIIFYNNDFEVFIDATNTASKYGEIELNALNTVWDLYLERAYRAKVKADFSWDLDKLKSAVKIYGTINNPTDLDSLWSVEMAIPLKPYMKIKGQPNEIPMDGEQWRINFSRVEWDFDTIGGKYYRKKIDGKYLPEYNWVWSNQKVINMHEPEKWGYLQFSDSIEVNEHQFNRDIDESIIQVTYALYRKTHRGDLSYLKKKDSGFSSILSVIYADDDSINSTFIKKEKGYEFTIVSPNTQFLYTINQIGQLSKTSQ